MRVMRVCFVLSLLLTICSGMAAQAQPASGIESMKLLAPDVGWAATKDKIFWTANGGAQWSDITPKTKAQRIIASVFFLDSSNGWALLAYAGKEYPTSGISETLFELASTSDSGASWSVQHLDVPDPDSSRGLSGEAWLDFLDSQHGWLMVRMNSNTAVSIGVLRATEDGGKTWHARSAPVAGPTRFLTPKDGWLAGGPTQDQIRALFVTHDGGGTWQEQRPKPPSQTQAAVNPTYDLPVFEDSRHGFLPVSFSGPDGVGSALVLFATADAGITWNPDRVLLNLPEISQGVILPSAVADSAWICASASGQSITITTTERGGSLTIGPTKNRRAEPPNLSEFPSILQLGFADETRGWLLLLDGGLYSTSTGGAAWKKVTPPSADRTPHQGKPVVAPAKTEPRTDMFSEPVSDAPSTTVSTHIGLDTFPVIPSGDMQNWSNDSPYYDVGIYLPGSKNKTNDPKLTSAWLSSAQGQGWGIVPLWFGLQSACACRTQNPCVPFTYQFSTNTSQAKTDGINEATAAISSAQKLGLSPTIIYHDIENYTPDGSTCSLPVQAFLSGWDQQMQTVGKAGVYGNPAPAAQDFSKATPIPDDVWVAKYPAQGQVPQVTTWALGKLPDSPNWTSNQRIRQSQQNLVQAWGSATSYKIDFDIENATVVDANNGSKLPSSYTYTSLNYPNATATYAWGINDAWTSTLINGPGQTGQIVGQYEDTSGAVHGFLLTNGTYTSLDYPGAVLTVAYGTNNLGQIVGVWQDSSSTDHGFLLSGGKYVPLNYPGSSYTFAYGINDAGQVVGIYDGAGGVGGFLYYGGNFYSVNYPGATSTVARGINGEATIAGSYPNNTDYQGFLNYISPPTWTGTFSTVVTPGAYGTSVNAVNDDNQVTGLYSNANSEGGFLFSYGVLFTLLQYPSGVYTSANSTNDFEQTVGYYDDSGSVPHGFVAIPQY